MKKLHNSLRSFHKWTNIAALYKIFLQIFNSLEINLNAKLTVTTLQ